MINTAEEISELLQGSFLAEQDIRSLTIDESEQVAFVLQVDRSTALDAWQLLRSRLADTQRYPIITEGWGSDEFFSRFYYQEEGTIGLLQHTSPEAIITSAGTVDLEAFLTAYKTNYAADLEESLRITQERFRTCPEEAQINQLRHLIETETLQSNVDLEKWFLDWEVQTLGDGAIAPLNTSYLDWFEPYNPQSPLLLLPTDNGWDSLAYLHWFGACSIGTPVAIRLLKQWHQRYDAELVCHYGTMLQCNVGKPPLNLDEAFELAWQQDALAPCTIGLPGISLRDHARSLLTLRRWFLHERP